MPSELRQVNWVVGGPRGAAALLGMNRTTLHSREAVRDHPAHLTTTRGGQRAGLLGPPVGQPVLKARRAAAVLAQGSSHLSRYRRQSSDAHRRDSNGAANPADRHLLSSLYQILSAQAAVSGSTTMLRITDSFEGTRQAGGRPSGGTWRPHDWSETLRLDAGGRRRLARRMQAPRPVLGIGPSQTFTVAVVTAAMNGPMEMHAELTTQKCLDPATAKGGPAIYTLTISRLAGIASTVQRHLGIRPGSDLLGHQMSGLNVDSLIARKIHHSASGKSKSRKALRGLSAQPASYRFQGGVLPSSCHFSQRHSRLAGSLRYPLRSLGRTAWTRSWTPQTWPKFTG